MRILIQASLLVFIPFLGISQQFFQQEDNLSINGQYGVDIFFGGGAVSFADFNGDGLDDLTFGTQTGWDLAFFLNKGDHFEKLVPPPIDYTYETKQVLWIDYDNDGDKDFFATSIDGPNRMYRNNGNFTFLEVTAAIGLPTDVHMSHGANFSDINKDGFLDVYICNSDHQTNGYSNFMYIWDQSSNQYIDYTIASGTGNGVRQSFCSGFFDMDMDGDLDLYVINDHYFFENSLYMNLGAGNFVDVSVPSGTNASIDAMNAGIGDYDNDADFDIFITNDTQAILYQNNGDNTFTDVAASANTLINQWSWSANWIDYDNDRDLDLYVSTEEDVKPNPFLVNLGNGTFVEPLASSGGLAGNDIIQCFSNARGDFNNDGKSDLMISPQWPGPFRLMCNHEETTNNFIKLDLEGVNSSKDAYGALIELYVNNSKRIYHKHSAIGYQCQNSDVLTLGIGAATAIDSIVIKWPFGNNEDVIYNSSVLINGTNLIRENAGVYSSYYNPLCLPVHDVMVDPVPSQTYGSSLITECNSLVIDGSNVLFQSQNEVLLTDGFEVEQGAMFEAEIEDCGN